MLEVPYMKHTQSFPDLVAFDLVTVLPRILEGKKLRLYQTNLNYVALISGTRPASNSCEEAANGVRHMSKPLCFLWIWLVNKQSPADKGW